MRLDRLRTAIRGSRFEPVARDLLRATWPRWRFVDDQASHHITQLLSYVLTESSCCIDVGCHTGTFLQHIVRLAPGGRHHAFEPLPHLAADLRRRFPQVDVHEVALSDRAGAAEFHHVTTNPGYSGLRRRTYDRANERVELLQVRTCRLDDVVPQDQAIAFIKIDVEGAELEVFRGAARTIHRCRPYIVFEHGLKAANHYGTTPHMIYRLLVDELDLSIFSLSGRGPLSADEFAAIYDRNSEWNFLARPYRRVRPSPRA